MVDPKQFWEDKILVWEEGRYTPEQDARFPVLEKIANRSSRSLRYRLHIACVLLEPFIKGKRVVEIGCGSGLLTKQLLDMGADSYIGYDIAENAITSAKANSEKEGTTDKASFHLGAIADLPPLEGDIVFSLGVLDWLTDAELEKLFEISGTMDYLHAIAEKRSSLNQKLHRLYVHLSYGHRTGAYVPRYYEVPDLEKMLHKVNPAPVHVYRHPHLSFGALLSSLPIPKG